MPDTAPVVAVVQARMSSSRLPGKVLMPIAGKPLLWHIVHRLSLCRTVDTVVIATSTQTSDDPIAEFCAAEGVVCVRGPLENVLERYRLAANKTDAQTLLRVTGDTPLIDPGFTDYLVSAMLDRKGDFVVLEDGALCAHDGVDVFSRHALDWLVCHAADDAIAREHVTSYFKLHPQVVKTIVMPIFRPLAFPHARVSIDTTDDLALIRALYERFNAAPGELNLTDALALLRDEPSYRLINAHVRQKTIDQVERHALICCQGGRDSGLGHLRRSLSLARALRDQQGFGVVVAVHGDESVVGIIRAAGFEAVKLVRGGGLAALAGAGKFSVAVVDVKDCLTREDVALLAGQIPVAAVIDDGSERRLAATHAYYPPVPQARALSWQGSRCIPRIGWQWCVLGFDPVRLTASPKAPGLFRIIITMGGADPRNFTAKVLEALNFVPSNVQADFVIGPAFTDPEVLVRRIEATAPRFRVLANVADLASQVAGADLAVIAFGVTAYEVAALGVPALYLSISGDHQRSATIFDGAGLGLALPEEASAEEIAAAVAILMKNDARRHAMHLAGPRTIDGQGAARIAAELAQALAIQPA